MSLRFNGSGADLAVHKTGRYADSLNSVDHRDPRQKPWLNVGMPHTEPRTAARTHGDRGSRFACGGQS